MKQKFDVMGMTCAACQAHVDKSVAAVEGVNEVNVNLLSENMEVDFDENVTSAEEIIKAVQKGGYDAKVKGDQKVRTSGNDDQEKALKAQKTRLILSFMFMIPLFYLSMGSMMGWPLPSIFLGHKNMMIFALTEILLCVPVLFINSHYFTRGFKSLFHGAPNMDSLIALGSGASVLYSLYGVYNIAYYMGRGMLEEAHVFHMNLYFESAAMILTLISLGKYFEARSKKKTKDALNGLMDLAPNTATVLVGDEEREVDINEIRVGDQVVVKSGEAIAVDGRIVRGRTTVDESMITGESIPVDKGVGDLVIGSTINKNGFIIVETLKSNDQSTLSQIIALVEEAGNSKAPIARMADTISSYFVPAVILIALVTFGVWMIVGQAFHFALTMAISVLVISCPCALGLATPTAIMVATGKAAKLGLLIKSAESLETLSHINMIVFDKTGTLTRGEPSVVDVEEVDDRLLRYGISLEGQSNHPLAEAIVRYKDIEELEVTDYEEIAGQGIRGMVNGSLVLAGNKKMMDVNGITVRSNKDYASAGKTPLYFSIDGKYAGVMVLQDEIKEEARSMVTGLSHRDIKTMMLTGDNERTAGAIAGILGMDYQADVLPQDKEAVIRSLQDAGYKVAMVGDGINDAPALMRADVGISFTSGLDIAIDSSDVVLMKNDLHDIEVAYDLSKATMKTIKQNLFWALFYNAICIPVAAGLFYKAFGWKLNPMIGSAAMSFSSVTVVSNALRLRFFKSKPHYEAEEVTVEHMNLKPQVKEENIVNVSKDSCDMILKIEGMMCEHCEKRVSDALNALEYVEAFVDQESDEAYINVFSKEMTLDMIKKAVEDAGYKVVSCEVNHRVDPRSYQLKYHIDGMTCKMCERRVKKVLNDIDGVEAAVLLYEDRAYINKKDDISEEELVNAVEEAGYHMKKEGEENMFLGKKEKVLDVEGMMCVHCQKHVSDALNAIDGVSAEVSLEDKKATVKLSKKVSDDVLKKAVEEAGYQVTGIH